MFSLENQVLCIPISLVRTRKKHLLDAGNIDPSSFVPSLSRDYDGCLRRKLGEFCNQFSGSHGRILACVLSCVYLGCHTRTMPLASQYLSILENVQAQITGLGLTFNGTTVPIVVKKTKRWLANISLPSLPLIVIAGEDTPESVVPWTTENEVLAKYHVDVVSIAGGNQDNTANLDVWLNWREQERKLFQWGMQAQIVSCFMSEFVGKPPILKEAFFKNYDVSGFGFNYWNVESRTN